MSAPANYIVARWAGTTRHPQTGAPVLLLMTEAGKMRLLLSQDCGESIVRTGEQFWAQSRSGMISQAPRSFGSPHLDGSTPRDGQNVCPPTRSSSAISGDVYAPSDSLSKSACQRPWVERISNLPQRLLNPQKTGGAHLLTILRPHRLSKPSHDGESQGGRKSSAALFWGRSAISDGDFDRQSEALVIIGGVMGLAIGMLLYFAVSLIDGGLTGGSNG